MKKAVIIFGIVAATSVASSTRVARTTGSMVKYNSGKESVQAFLVKPVGPGPFPALVVIHEWWGLNTWIKEQATKLADKGYLALAIDLYRGKSTSDREEAHELMRGVPEDRAAKDLRAAVAYLKGRKDVNKEKIGSIGWCMGGGYSLQAGVTVPGLAACVVNYGRLVTEVETIKKISCPVLGIFGEQDRGIPPKSVRKFEVTGKLVGKDVKVHIYPGVGHAFMNPGNKKGYDAPATAKAWETTLKFLDAKMK